ncbi:MAG: hypothetical protein PHR81_01275, partial [Bacteroidales bacterium]|nr:hypothetical protein [Bacteroidales bacterium]
HKTAFAIKSKNTYKLIRHLAHLNCCENVYPFGQYLHFIPKNSNMNPLELSANISDTYPDVEILKVKPDIEDCFINLMKETK